MSDNVSISDENITQIVYHITKEMERLGGCIDKLEEKNSQEHKDVMKCVNNIKNTFPDKYIPTKHAKYFWTILMGSYGFTLVVLGWMMKMHFGS